MQSTARRRSQREERLIIAVDRAIYHVARHWVWLLNVVGAIFVVLPLLAPVLMANGYARLANAIYRPFHLICHQLPNRSFHLMGYKMAYCERDFAIYSGLLLLGLLYGASRRTIRPAALSEVVALSLPIAIDGFTQLFGWRESTWELRVITGTLFAIAVAWAVYPRLDVGFQEITRTIEAQFERLAAEGRVTSLRS
jgi:uncharacterized membrane protein